MPRTYRRFPRINAEGLAELTILGDRRQVRIAWVKVVGAGGCLLVSDDSIGFLSLMEMRISLNGRELRADGRVAWEARQGSQEFHVGVEFLRIGRLDRAAIEAMVASSGAAA